MAQSDQTSSGIKLPIYNAVPIPQTRSSYLRKLTLDSSSPVSLQKASGLGKRTGKYFDRAGSCRISPVEDKEVVAKPSPGKFAEIFDIFYM